MTTQEKVPVAGVAASEAQASAPRKRRFTVAEYYRMAEVGILRPEERVELIEGEIIVMAPIGPNHAWSVDLDIPLFSRYAGDRFLIRIQNPIHLDDGSEPQPDISLLRLRPQGYGTAHPTPADVLLVIEVADSSLGI